MNELEVAKKAAKVAGRIAKKAFFSSFDVERKSGREFVTNIDKEIEQKVKDILSSSFPDHAVVGEEFGVERKGKRVWYIDPIDGTHNFMQHVPFFNTAIALEVNGIEKVGVVYNPILDEMFWAQKGKGAFMNGKRIKVKEDIGEVLFSGICYSKNNINDALSLLSGFNEKFGSIKKYGSAALELCYVAAGFLDCYFGIEQRLWDFKAGVVIVREANGSADELMIRGKRYLIASNKKLFPKLAKLARRTSN